MNLPEGFCFGLEEAAEEQGTSCLAWGVGRGNDNIAYLRCAMLSSAGNEKANDLVGHWLFQK
jgi:hypothetical protein